MILYLHGFCSSSASTKALQLKRFMAERGRASEFVCPDLDPKPAVAAGQIGRLLAEFPAGSSVTLIGSSLGGYYATHFAERDDLRAVLVNPALPPHLDRVPLIGEHRNFHSGAPFRFTKADDRALRLLAPTNLNPRRYLLLLEEGDEVLDPRVAKQELAAAEQVVLAGGDHSFTRFAELMPAILAFADRPRPAPARR